MTKPFITYTSQIEKLQNEKNLIIEDISFALETLQNISYYALISGYKQPFIDARTRKYLPDTHFADLLLLYIFDEELRSIFFKYLCKVERKLRSSISYRFCERHGEIQATYLDCHNYSTKPDYRNGIAKLLKILAYIAKQSTDHKYIVYQRNKYHNIPLWVTINVLTFGQLSKMFEFLQFKKQLIRLFNWYENHSENLNATQLLSYMGFPENWKNITRFRMV